ncbi:MAG: hypothetical protein RLZZ338_2735 [Cyanobacteriota bacterium]|jgi:hypothetical protein
MREEGRRKREEGRRKKEEGRGKREEKISLLYISQTYTPTFRQGFKSLFHREGPPL